MGMVNRCSDDLMSAEPLGLSLQEAHEWNARRYYRQGKQAAVNWLMTLRDWKIKADLTFESLAAPERAEKAVRAWLRSVAPGAWAVVGYERQERGAVHAHLVIDAEIDQIRAEKLWHKKSGFCRIAWIHAPPRSIDYALTVKHAIKELDVDVFGPGHERGLYSTGEQLSLGVPEPTPLKAPSGSRRGKKQPGGSKSSRESVGAISGEAGSG